VDVAVAAGADAVGFVFYGPSPRNLVPQRAAVLASRLPKRVRRVAVTLHPSQALVDSVLAAFMPDVWQSDAADFAGLDLPARIERWPVLRAGEPLPAVVPARFLFEGARSGAGERADWSVAAQLARRGELVLGGGLDAGNVGAAIAAVRPWGVDVSSGVESAPGVKDPDRIEAFVRAARAAAQEL
jgi:phosphoribosylanthranilate isomerase